MSVPRNADGTYAEADCPMVSVTDDRVGGYTLSLLGGVYDEMGEPDSVVGYTSGNEVALVPSESKNSYPVWEAGSGTMIMTFTWFRSETGLEPNTGRYRIKKVEDCIPREGGFADAWVAEIGVSGQ